MPGIRDNMALITTFVLWVSNACVGPTGWIRMWTGIHEIFASISVYSGAVAAWIWQTIGVLRDSFGGYRYAQLAVDVLLVIYNATCIIVSGLFLSYTVHALGHYVWTLSSEPNMSRCVVFVYAVHVFLPLVLAWIVLGLVCFYTEDQGEQDAKENDGDDTEDQGEQDAKENDGQVAKAAQPLLVDSRGVQTMPPLVESRGVQTLSPREDHRGTTTSSSPREDHRWTMTPSPPGQDSSRTTTLSPPRQDSRKRSREQQTGDDQNPGNKKKWISLLGQLEADTDNDCME